MSDFIGTKLTMNLGERSYDIILKNGALENLYQFARLDRKVAVVTDSGVPAEYALSLIHIWAAATWWWPWAAAWSVIWPDLPLPSTCGASILSTAPPLPFP